MTNASAKAGTAEKIGAWASVAQSLLTCRAILAGGGWALWEFGLKRVSVPRIELHHAVTALRISPDYRLIHLSVAHENKGDTLVRLGSADIRLQRVLPLPDPVKAAIEKGENPGGESSAIVPWPLLCRLKHELRIELEPNERHETTFEFIIPAHIEAVRIYSYFPNETKSSAGGEIGWARTTIFRPHREEAADVAFRDTPPRSDAPFVCARDR